MNGIAFEASVIEQLTDIAGVSSTTLLDVAVDNGYKIFDGNSSNWTSTVKPALTNYSSQTLTDIENWWINASPSWRVAVPEDGNLVKDSWQGHGYYAISPWQGAIGIIGGGLKGGSGAAAVTLPAMESSVSEVSAYMASIHPFQGDPDKYAENKPTATKTDDPVTVRTGSATYFNTDIVLGNQGYPYSLNFSKSYSSSSRFSKGPLGWGWSHNHSSSLKESSCGLTALGIYNPMLGAEGLVHLFVTNQLFSDLTKPLDKWVVVSIANRWFIDLCWRNTVNVSAQGLELVFFKKPDGTYTLRTGNLDAELTQLVGGNYKFVTSDLVEYTYDSNNLLSTVSFPYGVTVTYSYSSGKLASVSNNLGRTLTLSYTGDLLSSVSDGTGRTVSYQYDTDENLEKITYPDGEEIVFDYDLPGRMTKQFLSESPLSEVFINTFDSLGRVKEQADQNGEIWKFFLAGTRSRLEDPNGVSKVEKYDSFGNLISVINRFGGETSFEYDGLQRKIKQNSLCGNISEWTYDSLNRLVESRESAIVGSGLSDKVKTFTYDSTWTKKISTITNALGDTTTISYHSTYGKIASVVYPLIGSSNPSISLTYNAKGQIDSITDAVGMVRTYSYNSSNGNLESFVIDDGGLDVTGTLVYDTVGDIISYTDHNGNETTFDYDSSRNRIKVDGPSTGGPEAEYVFDEDGNLTKVKAPTGDISNPWNETEFVWNIDGTIEKLKRNGVDFVTLEYDSKKKVQKITDAVGRITTYTRDSYDRISSIQESVSGTIAQFFYTSCGKISEARDANGNASLNSYDGFGRLKKIEYPDSSYEEFAYDALDNLVSLRRRGGGVSTFSYDEIGRPITISRTGLPTISLEYDFQRITEMSTPAVTGDNSTGQFKFEYDSAGRLSKEIYPDLKEVSYTRDVSGRLTRLTYPDGYYVEYFYDTEDRLVDIKLNGSSSSAISFEYDKQGRRERIVYGNGATADLVYDTNSLLESVEHTFNGSAVTYDYSFNAAFEVVSQSVSDSQYMWHPAAAGTDTYSTANNLNQYSTVNGSSYTYDNYGNLTSDGTWTFSYDSEGCLISASKTGTSVSFKYDPYSRLAIRIQGSGRTRYIYDGLRRIAEYDDVADTLTKRYVFGPGLDEAFIEIDSSGTIKYLHHDRVNSVIAVTDATGVVLNANKYSPFGKVGSTIGSTFGFTGQVYDADLELYFYKLRFYSPALGRFLQPDPIGYKGGSNLYAYVENNPLSYSDPFGLLKKDHKDPTPDPVPPPNLEALLLAMEAIYRVASISKPRTSPRVCIVNAGVSYWYLNTQEQTHLLHKAFELFMASEGFKGNCPKDGDDIGKWGELEVQKFLSYLYSSLSHNSKRFYYNTSGATYAIPDFIFSDPDPAFDGKTAFAEVKVKRAKDPYYDMDLPDIDTILKANQRGLYTYAARTRNGEVFTNDRNTIFPTPMPVDFFRITFWNGDVPLPVNHPGG